MDPGSSDRSSPRSVPHNLPSPLTTLVGRREELVDVAHLLAERRIVTLVGAPGIGKTRLALRVAAQLQGRYTDGVWLVDVAEVPEPNLLVAHAVAAVLSVREQPAETITSTIARNLTGKKVLLVLDNCEHLARSCAELACVLLTACPHLTVLATSRQALGVAGEGVWPVRPLAVPGAQDSPLETAEYEAVRLFMARVPKPLALDNDVARVVGSICRRLDGIPLAIELAAGRVGELTPHEVEGRLDDRFELLSSRLAGLPGRHQALHTALEWSHNLLPELEAVLLRRLAVFAGSFDEDAAREVCADSRLIGSGVGHLLRGLAGSSLVVGEAVGPRTRYHLHETIRHYARDKLVASGEAATYLENHARWCARLAEQADDEQSGQDSANMARLTANAAELRAALVWSLEHDSDLALALAGSLSRFWLARGHLYEGKEWLSKALTAAPERSTLRARALWGAALIACLIGDTDAVAPAAQEALYLAEEAGDVRTSARVLSLLGVFRVLTEPATAPDILTKAVARAREAGVVITLTGSLGMLGFARYLRGELAMATESLQECVAIGRSFGDSQALAIGLVGWGTVSHQQGALQRAKALLEDGLAVARRVGDPIWSALGLGYLADVTIAQGNYSCARQIASEAIRTAQHTGSCAVVALCLAVGAKLELGAGNPSAALQPLQEALSICRSSRLTGVHAQVLVGLGRVRMECGQLDEAQLCLEEAVVIAKRADNPLATAEALHWLARLVTSRNDRQSALGLHMEALGLQGRARQLAAVPSSLEALARLVAEEGHEERAARLLGASESLRARTAVARSVVEQSEWAVTTALIEEKLESIECQAAHSAGARLTADEAIAYTRRAHGPRGRQKWGWTSLTPTESRVVDLVAGGLTNREVGERLLMSPRTAQTHLAKVFRKLHLKSRTELAREVARRRPQDRDAGRSRGVG